MPRFGGETALVFLGGDRRTLAAARWLVDQGVHVAVCGFDPELVEPGINLYRQPAAAAAAAQMLVLPIPGPDDQGVIRLPNGEQLCIDRHLLRRLPPGAVLVTGRAGTLLAREAQQVGVVVHELLARDDFAYYNALPTAEGAIWEAMKRADITLAHSQAHVVGFGRCGKALAGQLRGLYALTTVVVKDATSRAEAAAAGFSVCTLDHWETVLPEADFIFNTAPALVLDRQRLLLTKPSVVIIDIASAPGGVDFAAARALGRTAVLCPGLPARIAPKTAGLALARVLYDLLGPNHT